MLSVESASELRALGRLPAEAAATLVHDVVLNGKRTTKSPPFDISDHGCVVSRVGAFPASTMGAVGEGEVLLSVNGAQCIDGKDARRLLRTSFSELSSVITLVFLQAPSDCRFVGTARADELASGNFDEQFETRALAYSATTVVSSMKNLIRCCSRLEGGGRAKNLERICVVLKIRPKTKSYNEAAVELRLTSLSFSSYDEFIPNSLQMSLAADAFESEMLAAGRNGASLGYSIGEVESKLSALLSWSERAARPLGP